LSSFSHSLESSKVTSFNTIINEPLFYNHRFLIGKQSIFYIWYEAGICFVGDITDQHGTFLSKECLATKYNITINHLNYLGIKYNKNIFKIE